MKNIPNDQAADSPAMPDRRKFLVAGQEWLQLHRCCLNFHLPLRGTLSVHQRL